MNPAPEDYNTQRGFTSSISEMYIYNGSGSGYKKYFIFSKAQDAHQAMTICILPKMIQRQQLLGDDLIQKYNMIIQKVEKLENEIKNRQDNFIEECEKLEKDGKI